jgi:hypothetical protein
MPRAQSFFNPLRVLRDLAVYSSNSMFIRVDLWFLFPFAVCVISSAVRAADKREILIPMKKISPRAKKSACRNDTSILCPSVFICGPYYPLRSLQLSGSFFLRPSVAICGSFSFCVLSAFAAIYSPQRRQGR